MQNEFVNWRYISTFMGDLSLHCKHSGGNPQLYDAKTKLIILEGTNIIYVESNAQFQK